MISSNSCMFQYQSTIQRESTKTQEPKSNMPIHVLIPHPYLNWCVGLVFLCFNRLPEDGTLVLKHIGVNTVHELCFMICILLSALVGWCIEYKMTVINDWILGTGDGCCWLMLVQNIMCDLVRFQLLEPSRSCSARYCSFFCTSLSVVKYGFWMSTVMYTLNTTLLA